MSVPFQKWAAKVNAKYKGDRWGSFETTTFLRDPIRPMKMNPSMFFSPADGTIIYQKVIKNNQELVDIKGMNYTLSDLMERQFEGPCLVIGIFMTSYDVHVNRIPMSGVLRYKMLAPITSYNIPMIFVENDILDGHLKNLYSDMKYVKYNARMINEIYNPSLDYRYFVTQIADDEVNVITPFSARQSQWFNQNQRFSFVRWGSQVELVLPLDKRYNISPMVPSLHHIQGGIDPLVRILPR